MLSHTKRFPHTTKLRCSAAQPHKTFASHNQTLSHSALHSKLPSSHASANLAAAACHSPAHLAITCSPSASALLSPLGVAVVGGGPAGTSAAKALAQVFLLERNPAGAKPCGSAIPLCMLDEFTIPP